MKVIVAYDTESKECQVLMNGEELDDVQGLNISKYGNEGKYDLCVMKMQKGPDGVIKQEMWSCYASTTKNSDALKDFFKKS